MTLDIFTVCRAALTNTQTGFYTINQALPRTRFGGLLGGSTSIP